MNNSSLQRCLVFLADGSRKDRIDALVREGKLPNIKRWLIDEGKSFNAVTTFPSTTGPAYLPFLTGCGPGTCNVPGIRWFDKQHFGMFGWPKGHRSYVGLESFLMGRDIAPQVKTVFDTVPKSYSIFNAVTPRTGYRNLTSFSRIWYAYYAHLTDRWDFADDAMLEKALQAISSIPDLQFLFTVFPGIDEFGHLSGPESERTTEQYLWLDNAIGEVVDLLVRQGQWEDTALWLVSDHGLSATHTHFCLNTFLESHNIPTFSYPLIHRRFGVKASTMVSGNGMAHIALRHPHGWKVAMPRAEIEHHYPELLADLLREPAADLLVLRENTDQLVVLSKRGQAQLGWQDGQIAYQVQGSDPFGYAALPERFSIQQSLELTYHSDYPDAPYQILQLFRSTRVGDIVVSATPGFDLRLRFEHPEHKGSHGSLHRLHMHVPLICNKRFSSDMVRTTDTYPTFLQQLGLPASAQLDGQIIL